MKFSNFLFPESKTPADDFGVIEESLDEAVLTEELGFDALWLAEHHFDGGCVYVDPVTFAAAIAARTKKVKIGFAVAQMALHHPIRFAEQIALIDNISRGRMIVGVGRGTAYNFYEFRGYGIDPDEAHERLLEVEDILIKSWTTQNYKHEGKYWQVELPVLRPQVYQKPHPPMIRACSGLESTLEMAREGRPFLMNLQSDQTTKERMDLYRSTMFESGFNEEAVARSVADSWVWRNIFVADTDAEAEAIAVPHFRAMRLPLGQPGPDEHGNRASHSSRRRNRCGPGLDRPRPDLRFPGNGPPAPGRGRQDRRGRHHHPLPPGRHALCCHRTQPAAVRGEGCAAF